MLPRRRRRKMIRLPILLVTLVAVPAFAGGDVWRWRDGSGLLHYSNMAERVPAYAERVETQLGHVSLPAGAPAGAKARRETTPPAELHRAPTRGWGGTGRGMWG